MKEYIHHTQIDEHFPSRLPGFLLVESSNSSLRDSRIIEEGIKRFYGSYGETVSILDLDHYKLALLIPEELGKLSCISFYRSNGDFAFIEGTFYDYELLKENKTEILGNKLAKEVIRLGKNKEYLKLKDFNGRYSGFCYIKNTQTLTIITDSYGSNRVFVYGDNQNFVVSNSIFALSKNPALKVSVCEESIAQIIHYEYPAYRQTEFNEIELVLPSDVLLRFYRKSISRLKSFQQIDRTPILSKTEYINNLRESINHFFLKLDNYMNEPLGIYLSKGKDSRLFLPFLERNQLAYIPFVFREDTGIFDYPQVKEIVRLLGKELHVMESHSLDRKLSFLLSMSTTHTSPWLALAKIASGYVSNALMGLYGESSSGKLCAYRNYGIRTMEDTIQNTILGNSRGISQEDVIKWVPYYNKFDTVAGFRKIYEHFPDVQIPFDYDTYQDIDHRSFRNAIVVLLKAQHFITPITPFMDKEVSSIYHSLPQTLLKSQIAHTVIASEEPKSNHVMSTAFPISLKNEKYIRPLLLELVRFNNKYKDVLMSHKKKYKPFVRTDHFVPRSAYFKNLFSQKTYIGNPRILTRMYNIDDYLHLTFEDNVDFYNKTPRVITNELKTINSGGEIIK